MLPAVSAPAQKPGEAQAAPVAESQADRAAVAFAEARGRLLFGIDRAAWVATDDMTARLRNWRNQGLRGYVVEQAGGGFTVTFYGGPAEAPVAVYRGDVRNHRVEGREIFPAAARPPLTPAQRRLVAAREAATAANRNRPCGNAPFNTAVIPPASAEGPIDVYLLTPQPRQGHFPLGGHFRLTVAADGRVSGERAFTNTCIVFGPPQVRGGGRVSAMIITHLLDPVPTEIHVFSSLASGFPVYVGIVEPRRMYVVNGDRIRLLADPPGGGA